jgi:hypothetical protein
VRNDASDEEDLAKEVLSRNLHDYLVSNFFGASDEI